MLKKLIIQYDNERSQLGYSQTNNPIVQGEADNLIEQGETMPGYIQLKMH